MIRLKEESKNICGKAYCYEMTSKVIDWEDGMKYTTYGIMARDTASDRIVGAYPDVSLDKDAVRKLVDKCNECELQAIHLKDAVLDFIG